MVLKFRLISDEQDDFIRDIEILAEQTFFQFHMVVQENLHFDKSQIASFFICNRDWEKEQEITLFELSEEEAANVVTMDSAKIGDHVSEVHDKLMYVFDVFNERLFFIELVEKHPGDPARKYPYCCLEQGKPPHQLLMDQLFGTDSFTDNSFLDDHSFGEDLTDTGSLDDLGYDSEYFDEDPADEN